MSLGFCPLCLTTRGHLLQGGGEAEKLHNFLAPLVLNRCHWPWHLFSCLKTDTVPFTLDGERYCCTLGIFFFKHLTSHPQLFSYSDTWQRCIVFVVKQNGLEIIFCPPLLLSGVGVLSWGSRRRQNWSRSGHNASQSSSGQSHNWTLRLHLSKNHP